MASASLQQRTPAWHAARRGKLTASNLGAAMGLCPWTSRNQAFQRAMGLDRFEGKALRDAIGTAPVSEFRRAVLGAGNDATRWGQTHESDGILAYSAHTGNLVDATGLHVHPSSSWLAGSPDGLIGTDGLLEVKCPYWRRRDGTRVHATIPSYYYMQLNLCLECTNREWCDFISWSPEGYAVYRVTRDSQLHEAMMPHYLKFFAAMSRMAKVAPVQSKQEKEQIEQLVIDSMSTHIDYNYWSNADTTVACPSPEPDDMPSPKRPRVADIETGL